jgi:AhpD family alkylhydroperoxidase
MARIPYVEIESAPRAVQEILRAGPRNTRNIQGLIAHASGNLSGLSAFLGSVLTAQALEPRLRELAILRVAYLTGAEYEWTQHTTLSARAGVSPAQLAAIAEGRTEGIEFSQDEATLLAFVSQFIDTGHPDAPLFGRTRSFLSDREIVELLLAAGAYWALGRLMTALEIDAEPPMDEADAATLLASFPSA